MPVQKYKAADDDEVYEAEGPKGARHTLFSGTQVLQAGAGGGSSTEVLAVVTATGMTMEINVQTSNCHFGKALCM
jgi:magnesium-transporting ATPase (P-type)